MFAFIGFVVSFLGMMAAGYYSTNIVEFMIGKFKQKLEESTLPADKRSPEIVWLDDLCIGRYSLYEEECYIGAPVVVLGYQFQTDYPKFRFQISGETYSEPVNVLDVYNNPELRQRVEYIVKRMQLVTKLESAKYNLDLHDAKPRQMGEIKIILDKLAGLD